LPTGSVKIANAPVPLPISVRGVRVRPPADLVERVGARIHHDVRARVLVRRSIAFLDPRAADTAGVVEGDRSIGAAP
jgi:hypothetical protein